MLSADSELLEKAYKTLNIYYFDSSLPDVVITIQSQPKSYGYITTSPVWIDESNHYYEINITAEYLARPIYNVMATLLHEMCHLYAMINNIKDTSQNGRYHNKRFKEIAEHRDLIITYMPSIGYSKTEPSDKFISVIEQYGLDKDIKHYRSEYMIVTGTTPGTDKGIIGVDGKPVKPKKKSSTRKYICPSCKLSVRATKDVFIICGNCNETMIKE